ncbi:outer spore coat protein CotE [Paenibacillus cisolokensis]|jgi:Outer spore coat protein E (CotE).|uniref:Spore coat protein E n=1 Tax=Paenibacillus cisolokensis TaxID=1658519 RepID=A0ABQ4N4N6_9BACL|nr:MULTISPECIES: outer spore coat protein CotE [Paenibacillus]ALS27911.1 spore coat protein [Paenibacillus sp. 32O-W]GIQ62911.1 spore coat protein E [Paenibacillus cisolokensis]
MALADKQLQFREIITKAVCGKGRKFSTVTHTVTPPHHPTSILGAWIINHQYEAVRSGDGIEVIGTYDINIWYSYNKNTQTDVAKETVSYVENVPLSYVDPKHRASTEEVSADATQEPNCIEANISSNGSSVAIRVEREFAVELVAETKVCVAVNPNGCDDLDGKDIEFGIGDDDFEDLDPDLLDDEL